MQADFSGVRIYEGDHASAIGAVAYTRGETIHFSRGRFQPRNGEGQKLLGHELAHVVQQRQRRVRSTAHLQGLPVNDDPHLEQEAEAIGTKAAAGGAPSGTMRGTPQTTAAAPEQGPVQGMFEWLWNWGKKPQRSTLALPAAFPAKRPKKSATLKGKTDSKGNTLTAHHKYPYNQIAGDATHAIATGDADAHGSLQEWGQSGKSGTFGASGLAWAPHNIFFGPLPEHRSDDPKEQLDTHFTKSGTVTPKSELALDIEHQGGIHAFDADALRQRLSQFANLDASGYDSDEWEDDGGGKRRQKGRPADWGTKSIADKVAYAKAKKKPWWKIF